MQLSIIVPMYNVEKYIARCLDSLLQQDIGMSDYEIIVVNDGSPDGSDTIVKKYMEKYPHIKYIVQKNGGPGNARNSGIKNAKGDYLWFVDADDKIRKNCLKGLLSYAFRNNLDFCEFDCCEVGSDGSCIFVSNKRLVNRVVDNREYAASYAFPFDACFHIIKRERVVLNNLLFIEGIYHEDREFNIRLLEHCRRISSYDDTYGPLYYYIREREESTMNNRDETHLLKRIDSYVFILNTLREKYQYNREEKNYAFYVNRLLNDLQAYSLFPLVGMLKRNDTSRFYRRLAIENNLRYATDVAEGKSKIKFFLLNLCRKSWLLSSFFIRIFNVYGTCIDKRNS